MCTLTSVVTDKCDWTPDPDLSVHGQLPAAKCDVCTLTLSIAFLLTRSCVIGHLMLIFGYMGNCAGLNLVWEPHFKLPVAVL